MNNPPSMQQQLPVFQQYQPQMTGNTSTNDYKSKVFVHNLDMAISEDYLFKKFKEETNGQIQNLKIHRDKTSQKSKGFATITFSHPDHAEEARKKLDGAVFIKNIIRVKPFLNLQAIDRQANIHFQCKGLGNEINHSDIEQYFSQFGNIQSIEIKHDHEGNSLQYGYIQFEKAEDVDKLLKDISEKPLIIKGQQIQIERFKSQIERGGSAKNLFFRAFARPIEISNPQHIRAYEYGWQLSIMDFFNKNNVEIKSCYVNYDEKSKQPWAMVFFASAANTQDAYNETQGESRFHQCLRSTASRALELIKQHGAPKKMDEQEEFKIETVEPFFHELEQSPSDPYKGSKENFFCNFSKPKSTNIDKRVALLRNIKQNVSDGQIREYAEKFGTVIDMNIFQPRDPNLVNVRQAFVYYQTESDANNAYSEIYEKKMYEKNKEIYNNAQPFITIKLPKIVRNELKKILSKSKSQAARPQSAPPQSKLIPQWQNPVLPPFQMAPGQRPYHQFRPSPGQPQPYIQNQQPMYPPQQRERGQMQRQPYPHPGQGVQQTRQNRQFPGNRFPPPGYIQPMGQMPPGTRGYPQPNQFINPRPQIVSQPQFSFTFNSYDDIKNRMDEFTKTLSDKQKRTILGTQLVQRIKDYLQDKKPDYNEDIVKRITGMLVDESQFEVSEILQLFESQQELEERVEEGYQLIQEEENEKDSQSRG